MSYKYLFIQIQMNAYKEVQFLSFCVPPYPYTSILIPVTI